MNHGHWQLFSRPIKWWWRQMAVSALRKHVTLLWEPVKLQALSCCHSSTGCCRRYEGKAPALARRRKKKAAQWSWVCGWLCMWGNLAGLRGQCLSKFALNCKCRFSNKLGTSRYWPGYVQKPTWYMQIQTWIHADTSIHADTNLDTCRYEPGYVQIQTEYVQILINICIGAHALVVRTQKYVHKYVYPPEAACGSGRRYGDRGTIPFGYSSGCRNGAHRYNHDLAAWLEKRGWRQLPNLLCKFLRTGLI